MTIDTTKRELLSPTPQRTNPSTNNRSRSAPSSPTKTENVATEVIRSLTPEAENGGGIPLELSQSTDFTKDLNALVKEDREWMACLIQRVSKAFEHKKEISSTDLEAYQDFEQNFLNTYKQCIPKALELHAEFMKIFGDVDVVTYDETTRVIVAPYEMLKIAHNIAFKHFQGLMSLAKTTGQCRCVAHLLQIILVGCQPQKPYSSTCFYVKELIDREQPLEELEGIGKGKSVFDAQIDQITERLPKDDLSPSTIMASAFTHFHRDVIENKNVVIVLENQAQLWPREEEGDLEGFLNVFKKHCSRLLNKEFVREYIRSVLEREQSLFRQALEIYSSPTEKKHAPFPESVLENLMCQVNHETWKIIQQGTSLTEKEYSEIPKSDHLEKGEVESFLRLKFLELIIMLPPFNDPYVHRKISIMMRQYKFQFAGEKKRFSPIKPVPVRHTHVFNEELTQTKVIKEHALYVSSDVANSISPMENIGGRITLGTVRSSLVVSSWHDNNGDFLPPRGRLFDRITFDWRIAEPLATFIMNTVHAGIAEDPISKKVDFFVDQLKIISTVNEKSTLIVPENGPLYVSNPGAWNRLFGPTKITPEQYKEWENNLELLFNRGKKCLEQHISIIKITSEDPIRDLYFLIEIRKLLENAAEGLSRLAYGNFGYLISEIHTELLPLTSIASHLMQLTTRDEEGWLEFFGNGIFQSNNPNDIDWKIQNYRRILIQLKNAVKTLLIKSFGHDTAASLTFNCLVGRFEVGMAKRLQDIIQPLFTIDLEEKERDGLTQEYLSQVREGFQYHFIMKLRNLLKELETTEDGLVREFAYNLCEFLYTGINMEKECFALTEKFKAYGSSLPGTPLLHLSDAHNARTPLSANIDTIHELFVKVPDSVKAPRVYRWANSVRGRWNINFDPMTQGNRPHVLGTLLISGIGSEEKRVNFLALGSPTQEGTISRDETTLPEVTAWRAKIIPEFTAWIHNYKKQGKKHLFIINQDYREKYRILGGDETDRINAILGAANESLYVILLSKNSKFFCQDFEQEIIEMYSHADTFKNELIRQHFNDDPSESGNLIPQQVREQIPELENLSQAMASHIHISLFNGKEKLSVPERQIFIDVFHDLLCLLLIVQLDVNSFNISCKDAIDRAADSISRLWAHLGIVNNIHHDELFRKRFESLLFARAMMVRKRPIFKERVDRTKQAVAYLESHPKGLRILHKEIFPPCSFGLDNS